MESGEPEGMQFYGGSGLSWLEKHTGHLREVMESWLSPDNDTLKKAVEKTVKEGYFPRYDVEFQLHVFRANLTNGDLEQWVRQSGLSDERNAKKQRILCLHAGNLPMVGFQDVVAVLLSGAGYFGKISKKDPYLIPSFLKYARNKGIEQVRRWSLEIEEFKNLEAGIVLFAGSRKSVPEVKKRIDELNAFKIGGKYLIRTAKFSMAYIDEWNSTICKNLTEAILRYSGKGCRSVAVVVSPYGLEEIKAELESQMKIFLAKNPPLEVAEPMLRHRHAYNKAVGKTEIWAEDFLIQEEENFPELEFCAHWVQGSRGKLYKLKEQFDDLVQNVYSVHTKEGFDDLAKAQAPELYWKPDGKDVIRNIIEF